jgi:hypothetical protein
MCGPSATTGRKPDSASPPHQPRYPLPDHGLVMGSEPARPRHPTAAGICGYEPAGRRFGRPRSSGRQKQPRLFWLTAPRPQVQTALKSDRRVPLPSCQRRSVAMPRRLYSMPCALLPGGHSAGRLFALRRRRYYLPRLPGQAWEFRKITVPRHLTLVHSRKEFQEFSNQPVVWSADANCLKLSSNLQV